MIIKDIFAFEICAALLLISKYNILKDLNFYRELKAPPICPNYDS